MTFEEFKQQCDLGDHAFTFNGSNLFFIYSGKNKHITCYKKDTCQPVAFCLIQKEFDEISKSENIILMKEREYV